MFWISNDQFKTVFFKMLHSCIYLHSAHRRRSLAALICTDVHRFSTKMSALCIGDDDDDDQISSYFLPGKTLSEYLVNGIIFLHTSCPNSNRPVFGLKEF
jgi:hypothetical protein